jgi:4-alpha-glucanotransferase
MHIGLYGDLAVGANPSGSEVWSNQGLYVQGAAVGAPPDPLALNGQDWGIPPINPHALREQSFAPLIELLRVNMQPVGALRIDHVMSLFRLWWVPRGFGAMNGVYVHYPLEESIAGLVGESTRARCLVIGEDLGTVPDEMRRAMEERRLFHYKVMLFEKHSDGRFKLPHEYAQHALATATTHDLPPLRAWWQGDDLALRDRLGLYPSADTARQLHYERTNDRCAMLRALTELQLWQWRDQEPMPEFSLTLARAIHLYLGQTHASLVLVQPEDLIGMTDPVNVPGTHTEHANWQRKLAASTPDIFTRADVRETLLALSKARATVPSSG